MSSITANRLRLRSEGRETIPVSATLVAAVSNRDRVIGAPHDFYRYPARFSPIFAREAIKAFTQPGDLVLDPFCGGGTTLVEAISLGRRAAGMDVSSLAAFLARTKTTPISVHDKRRIIAWLESLEADKVQKVDAHTDPELDAAYYQRNLPEGARLFFEWVSDRLGALATLR